MGKKSKTGKSRKDHFYALAKQQGFRARSAFKLTQLASKFRLFDGTLNVIDLCAAPGGWMQVARKALPVAGHVFGVDLVPIAPLRGCTSIVADITTQRCEKLLTAELHKQQVQNTKVELVLHDGAPNVGASWDKDAYVQNELVLKSLQLAVKYLAAGGRFVTKVFRSGDYTKLLYVFQQLFRKVQATKPQSSRNVSAEIFVVCDGYKAPTKISRDLFDLDKVFEAVEEADVRTKGVIAAESILPVPEKAQLKAEGGLKAAMRILKKKSRGGYDVGDDFRKCTVKQFFESGSPAEILVVYNQVVFEEDCDYCQLIKVHPSTTEEILEACQDLKLVGKPVYQKLLNWRRKILAKRLEAKEAEVKATAQAIESVAVDKSQAELDADADEQLEHLLQEDAKFKLKALRKFKAKQRKLELKAKIAAAVFVPEGAEPELFGDSAKSAKLLAAESRDCDITDGWDDEEVFDDVGGAGAISYGQEDSSEDSEDDEESENETDYIKKLETEMDSYHAALKQQAILKGMRGGNERKLKETRRQIKLKEWAAEMSEAVEDIEARNYEKLVRTRQQEEDSTDDAEGDEDEEYSSEIEDRVKGAEVDEEVSDADDETTTKEKSIDKKIVKKVFFADETFSGLKDGLPTGALLSRKRTRSTANSNRTEVSASDAESEVEEGDSIKEMSDSELPKFPLTETQRRKRRRKQDAEKSARREEKSAQREKSLLSTLGETIDEELVAKASGMKSNTPIIEVPIEKPQHKDEIAEVQAIGSLLTKRKSRMDLMDGLYNRWAFNDEKGLPEWFTEDDAKARVPDLPVTKEFMDEYRRKLREISERPIRKVAEAKARKKLRADKRMEAIKAQAMQIADSNEFGEQSKAQALEKLMRKARRGDKKKDKTYKVSRAAGGTKDFGPRSKKGSGSTRVVDKRLKKDKRAMKAVRKRQEKKR